MVAALSSSREVSDEGTDITVVHGAGELKETLVTLMTAHGHEGEQHVDALLAEPLFVPLDEGSTHPIPPHLTTGFPGMSLTGCLCFQEERGRKDMPCSGGGRYTLCGESASNAHPNVRSVASLTDCLCFQVREPSSTNRQGLAGSWATPRCAGIIRQALVRHPPSPYSRGCRYS